MAEIKRNLDLFTEKRLLQVIFHQPEFLDNPKVTDEIFQSSNTRNIYKSLCSLKDKGIPFTRDALVQEYLSKDIDGNTNIIDTVIIPQNDQLTTIDDIIFQLQDSKKRRTASALLKKAAADIDSLTQIDDTVSKIKDIIGEAESYLITDTKSVKKVMNFGEWAEDYEKELNKRRKGKQFYFHNFIFDSLIDDGPRPGEIGIIASASGSGKSTVCLNLVNDLISNNPPISCMYFSLEMSSTATMDRLVSRRLGIKYRDIVSPQPQSGEFEDIIQRFKQEKAELIQNKNFRFSEDASLTLRDLKKHIQKFQAELGSTYCIVILDLLSMVDEFQKVKAGQNQAQSIENGVNALSAMAKELGVHFIGVLQLNRTTEAEAGKIHDVKDLQRFRPNRAQIKNAHAYLERARWVVTTYRERMYAELYLEKEDYDNMMDIIEVSVVKINNGVFKKAQGLFNGEFFSVDPMPVTNTIDQN